MTKGQKTLWVKRIRELLKMADEVEKLKISTEWIDTFTNMGFYRGWVTIVPLQKSQIKNIAMTNSEAVFYLANKSKKVGLSLLEKLSIELKEESQRQKAINLIIKNGVTASKKDLEIIFNHSINETTLLDFM